MLILLSPTKQMDFSREDKYLNSLETPHFFSEAEILNNELKKLNEDFIMSFMKVSNKIAHNTWDNIINFDKSSSVKKSALFAYSGTVYQSLNAETLNSADLEYANNHMRILSGLYGVLKPSDVIKPYRLEMKTPLKNPEGENLYHFWKPRIIKYLMNDNSPIINLASTEYLKAVNIKKLNHPLISFQFKERNGDKVRTVGMYSKVARGLMARKIITEKISDPLVLQKGEIGGYEFDPILSSEFEWVFARNEF